MATAQDLFVQHFVTEITGNGNLQSELTATELSPGVLSIRGKLNQAYDRLYISFQPSRSTLAGAGQFSHPGVDYFGDPYNGQALLFSQIGFPDDLAPGDKVAFNVGYTKAGEALSHSLDISYTLPKGTVVDAGGADWHAALVTKSNTVAATGLGPTGTAGPGPLADATAPSSRLLAVFEANDQSPDYGRLIGISPSQATGISIPTFQVVPSLPALGTTNGEAAYVQATNQGYVWDGSAWRDIAPTPLLSFPTEADLLADTKAGTGSYAIARNTGGLYVRVPSGWRIVGIHNYANVATLLAATPVEGSLGEAVAEGMVFLRTNTGWRPTTLWEETEANIRANTTMPNGVEAISSDTGRTFTRIAGAWVEEPVQHYATEVALLAATPPDGTLAWADDTSWAFTRAGGAWNRLGGPAVTVGTADPQAAGTPTADGDIWADTGSKKLKVWQGGAWVMMSTTPIAVSAVAPTSPSTGDMWFDTSTPAYGVRYWDGSHWLGVNGTSTGAGTEGSYTRMPGYFDKDPSDTEAANDIMGLAGRYTGSQVQLWAKKGSLWHRATPKIGDPANKDKVVIGNQNGEPTWAKNPKYVKHEWAGWANNYVELYCFNNWTIKEYFSIDIYLKFKSNGRLGLIFLHGGTANANKIDPANYIDQFVVSNYGDSGMTNHSKGLYVTEGTGDYKVGANAPLTCKIVGVRDAQSNVWAVRYSGNYNSSNNTAFAFSGMVRYTSTSDLNRMTLYSSSAIEGSACGTAL